MNYAVLLVFLSLLLLKSLNNPRRELIIEHALHIYDVVIMSVCRFFFLFFLHYNECGPNKYFGPN